MRGLEALLREEAKRQSRRMSEPELMALFAADIELNAQDLGVWLDGRS